MGEGGVVRHLHLEEGKADPNIGYGETAAGSERSEEYSTVIMISQP